MKLAICGHGGAGKDEAGKYLASVTDLRYRGSTSEWAAEVVYREWGCEHYATPADCWADRRENRVEWAETILAYNLSDGSGTRLYRDMLDTVDILTGIRCPQELEALYEQHLIDYSLWIERPGIPPDPSCKVRREDCDLRVLNDGSLALFKHRLAATAVALEGMLA